MGVVPIELLLLNGLLNIDRLNTAFTDSANRGQCEYLRTNRYKVMEERNNIVIDIKAASHILYSFGIPVFI